MSLSSKNRAYLRNEAHDLEPLLHIGKGEVDENIVQELDNLLRTRELVKVQVLKNSSQPVKAIADELAKAADAELVQIIGKRIVFYRFSKELADKGKTRYFLP